MLHVQRLNKAIPGCHLALTVICSFTMHCFILQGIWNMIFASFGKSAAGLLNNYERFTTILFCRPLENRNKTF